MPTMFYDISTQGDGHVFHEVLIMVDERTFDFKRIPTGKIYESLKEAREEVADKNHHLAEFEAVARERPARLIANFGRQQGKTESLGRCIP